MTGRGNKRKILWIFLMLFFVFGIPSTIYAKEPQLTEENLQTVGGQVRTVEPMGLRFLSCIKDSYIEELEKQGDVEYGTVLLPEKYLGEQELTIDGKYLYNGKLFKPAVVKAKKIFSKQNGRTYFSAVLTNLSSKAYEEEYAARAYVKLTKEDGTVEIVYSAGRMTKEVYQVAKDAVEGTVETEEVKNWLEENVINKVENPESEKPSEEENKIAFQMGEVEYVALYEQNKKGKVKEVGTFQQKEFQPENYLVKVEFTDQPTIYAEVKELKVKDNKVQLQLKLDDYIYYDGTEKKEGAVVDFGTVTDGKVVSEYASVESLIGRMKKNPSGSYTLLKDMDFSTVSASGDEIIEKFTGTLDGNGYRITGLNKTLFGEVSGGTVKNLILDSCNIQKSGNSGAVGTLADVVSAKSVIENVHTKGSLTSNRNKTGGLIGEIKESSVVRYCSANVQIKNTNNSAVTGGLVGETASQASIYDSYATGTLQSNAKGVGGLVGWHANASIERCYAAVQLTSSGTKNMPGGFLGFIWETETSPGNIQKNVSFSYGEKGYKFDGMTGSKQFSAKYKENYTLAKTDLTTDELTADSEKTGINVEGKITEQSLEELKKKEFYTDTLGWSEEIWDFSHLSEGKAPTLKGIDTNSVAMTQNVAASTVNLSETMEIAAEANREKVQEKTTLELASMPDYQEDHKTAYTNLLKLMPFYDYQQIILEGNKLASDHALNTYEILAVYPLDNKGERVVAMTQAEAEKITKIRIQFAQEDATALIYNVSYVNTRNQIACYKLDQIPVHYTFKRHLIDDQSKVFQEVTAKAKTYTYDADIMNRPKGGEHNSVKKAYRNNYNNVVIPEMEDMFVSYFASHSELPVNLDNPIAQQIVRGKVLDEDYLKDYLCSYNYIDRWYDFVIGGVNMRDVILFDNDVMGNGKDASNLPIEMCRNVQNDERWGRRTQDLYRNKIGKYTGISEVDTFVEYFMKAYAGYEDVNDWIMENFEYGVLVEGKPKNAQVRDWRLWERLKQNNFFWWKDMVIPTLSYKTSKNLYVMSTTTYIAFGNLECYGGYQNTDNWRNGMRNRLQTIANDHANIFDNYATLSGRGASGINECKFTIIDQNLIEKRGQDVYVEYYEPLDAFKGGGTGMGAAAAVRGGRDYIYFNSVTLLDNVDTLTHELGHVTDSVVFMDGQGLRRGNEDINNGFSNQYAVDYNMNLMKDYSADSDALCNLTPERINTDEEFKSYYKGVFEALYTLDYLQGLAYLELTPEQQAAITAKHQYGRPGNASSQNQVNSHWRTLSASELENMQLETLEDLWDNQLMIRPGHRFDIQSNNWVGSSSDGSFGAYNLDRVAFAAWYVPYVENGSPNAQAYRRNAYELASIGGYLGGAQAYLKSAGGQDLARWKAITGKSDFNFKQWRMDKNKEIEEKINAQSNLENPYFDADAVIQYLKQNMINYGNGINSGASNGNQTLQNIKNSRENVFRYLQRITNQFTTPIYPEDESSQTIVEVTSAEQLIQEVQKNPAGIYTLKNDISMKGMTLDNDCYINRTFIGKIDGNGYQITDLEKPLLAKVANSYVTDLTLVGTNGNQNAGLLSKNTVMTIQVTEKKEEKEISTLEELQNIGKNEYKKYILKADIDASSITSGNALITGSFTSILEGDNHTIKGLKVPLFENVENGTVQNLKIKDASIQKDAEYVAAVAKKTNRAVMTNLNLENISVQGQSYTAAVTGRDYSASTYSKIQVRNAQIQSSGNNSGGFIGRAVGTKISDVAVLEGTVQVQRRGTGGFIGIAKDAKIDRVYSSAVLTINNYQNGDDSASAGFIGSIEGNSKVSHAFMAGSVENKVSGKTFYKFVGTLDAIAEKVSSSYELEGTAGESNVTDATSGKLDSATQDNKKEKTFYTERLTFGEDVWNLEWVADKGYPELLGMESQAILHIKSVEDVERMNEHPDQIFVLDTDLDFTNVEKTEAIVKEFTGTLQGNGHKISGLKVPFFKNLSGTVSNLFLQGSSINGDGQTAQGAFAVSIKNAVVSGVGLHQVTVNADGGHAAAFAGKIQNSQLSDIQVTDSSVTVKAGNSAGFACSVSDSTITNVFQNAELLMQEVSEEQKETAAGFAAKTDANSTFTNIISIGDVPAGVSKLMKDVSKITNGYEFAGADGLQSNDTAHVTEAGTEIWNEAFYRDTMHFSQELWEFGRVGELGHPILKGMDGEYKTVSLKISKPEDFKKLNKISDRTFTLTNDIDMSGYEGELVTTKFTGTLEGNGYSINNLRNTLFQELAGTVQNLKLKSVLVVSEDGAANALAKTAKKANIKKLYVSGMTLSGYSHTGLIGTDIGSIYENIGIENAKLEAKDNYAGILIAEMQNGNAYMSMMTHVLIGNGEVYTTDKEYVGGMIGKADTARMNYIVSNVNLQIPENINTVHTASFIGSGAKSISLRYATVSGGVYPASSSEHTRWKITHVDNTSELNNWIKIYHSSAKPGTVPSYWSISEPETWTGGLTSPMFYMYSMMLDTSIWNTDTASNKGYPILRGMPDAVEAPELPKTDTQ